MEDPYQNPAEFMYKGELLETDFYIAKIHWLRCVRRGERRSYKEQTGQQREEHFLSMNAIIRTDGPVQLEKPTGATKRARIRERELDLSSDEQTRIFNAT